MSVRLILAAALVAAIPVSANAQARPPASVVVADERQNRIEALERELVEATAAQEELQRELFEARREITRLRSMVNDLAAVRDAQDEIAAPPPAEGSAPPAASETPRAPAAAPPPAPPPRQTGSLGELPASATPGDAGAAYTRARMLLNNGRYAEAEAAFVDFLRVHPNAETVGDVRYLLAFTQLARNDFQPAAQGFLEYLQRTPNGPRAPEALVRLGMALGGMERTDQACAAFRDLASRYPRASQSVRDLAAREARALRCSA